MGHDVSQLVANEEFHHQPQGLPALGGIGAQAMSAPALLLALEATPIGQAVLGGSGHGICPAA